MIRISSIKNRVVNSSLWSNKASRAFVLIALFLLVATIIVITANVRPQEGRVIIGYTPYDRRLGQWWELYQIPFIGLVLLSINTALAAKLMNKDRLLSFVLLSAGVFIELIALINSLNYLINLPQ